MTPAELIEAALREDLRVRLGERPFQDTVLTREIALSGAEAKDAARIAVDALAGAGLVAVSAEETDASPEPLLQTGEQGGLMAEGPGRLVPAALPPAPGSGMARGPLSRPYLL